MKRSGKYRNASGDDAFPVSVTQRTPPVVTVDYEKYERFLEDAELTDEQKRQFIEALWQIIVSFVDLGFGVHPAQQAQNTCGQVPNSSGEGPAGEPDSVQWGSRFLTSDFEDVADLEESPVAEGVEE